MRMRSTLVALLFALPCALGLRAQQPLSSGELNPLAFPGADIGAQVNAAFASCVGGPCTVALPPRASYAQRTTIQVPARKGQVLDCRSSELSWQGAGDAIVVGEWNDDSPSGEIRNCVISLAQGNAAGRNGVLQHSRIWFSYRADEFIGWTNAESAGLVLDNDRGSNWAGYNERTHIENVSFSNDTVGVRLVGNDGGTNSFGRGAFSIWCNMHDGQTCLLGEHGADIYSAEEFVLHGNLSSVTPGRPATLLALNGADLRTTNGYIEAECGSGMQPSYLWDIRDANSEFQLPGGVWNLGGCSVHNAGTSANAIGSVDSGAFVLQAVPFAMGVHQANNPKVIWDGRSLRYGMPLLGGYPNGIFQVFVRDTGAMPEVDDEKDARPQQNVMGCTGPNGHTGAAGGCGFGPGYGLKASEGGTLTPQFALESTGGLGIRRADGQVAASVEESGRFRETLSTPVSASAPCTPGEFTDDANFHYVCVAKDRWKRVALSMF